MSNWLLCLILILLIGPVGKFQTWRERDCAAFTPTELFPIFQNNVHTSNTTVRHGALVNISRRDDDEHADSSLSTWKSHCAHNHVAVAAF